MTAVAYGSWQKACAGKRQYAQARFARRAARRAETHGGGRLHVYRCPFCDWFHVGHDKRER